MTGIYFVRHALPDFSVKDDLTRPLSEKGKKDAEKVREFLLDKEIYKAYSSPFKRSMDTIKPFTEKAGLAIEIIEDLRERKVDNVWIEDFDSFCRSQWEDFEYKLNYGECLREVQVRNIKALNSILEGHRGENIIIGTHGTALSLIINYYDKSFGYRGFERIKSIMPYIVFMEFQEKNLIG
ncbi:histidine phosphatase family protein [Clostridium polynesiense]|uniref:histidine phosphatase family protein n=1 Tax=Clostridium polynesiense TaxID=1325933 RepID=UPI00058E1B07|nr:histidine phosphatase family protein [Clostridium polynesiense]